LICWHLQLLGAIFGITEAKSLGFCDK